MENIVYKFIFRYHLYINNMKNFLKHLFYFIYMVRSSKHVLKYQTELKSSLLSQLFHDFKIDLQFYIDLLWDEKLPLKNNLSSKLLPPNTVTYKIP